jgi:amidophosphoribosyltransferase
MCGIFGFISSKKKPISILFDGLYNLQHRGQDGYGFICDDKYVREYGKVPLEFETNHKTTKALGHVRYTTSGNQDISCLQPLQKNDIFLVHNGNIPNVPKHDSSYLLDQIDQFNIETSLIKIMETIPLAYSVIIQTPNKLYVLRDRYGIRPLYYNIYRDMISIASETCVWQGDDNFIYEIPPGSIYRINKTIKQIYKHKNSQNSICAMELLYLMKDNSLYKGQIIYDLREKLGQLLAKGDEFSKEYIVVGIPRSGIPSGKGYANTLNLLYQQYITLKNNNRSFITLENYRKNTCHKKFAFDEFELKGKKIILIDDTIVRGTVITEIIQNLHQIGVQEIHVRIPAPPIVDVNRFGIAINNKHNLLLNKFSISEICENLNIKSLKFLSIEDLTKCIPKTSYMEFFGVEFNTFLF